jgi:hypothetical protein
LPGSDLIKPLNKKIQLMVLPPNGASLSYFFIATGIQALVSSDGFFIF